jgi:site-specific DNA-methyltransferase (adenine-specific)
MSKQWDCGVPGIPFWKAINEIMIPGAFLLAFGGTRTFHRLTCHIEDAGFEIKDMLMWLYGTGWPKGLDISKSIDKLLGKEREVVGTKLGLPGYSNAIDKGRNTLNMANYGLDSEKECQITEAASEEAKRWEGWNTTLKPAWEPIILAMKSCEGTYAENAIKYGVAGLNIDECRIGHNEPLKTTNRSPRKEADNSIGDASVWNSNNNFSNDKNNVASANQKGRWPANVILNEESAAMLDSQSGIIKSGTGAVKKKTADGYNGNAYGQESRPIGSKMVEYGDSGGASRFFYISKVSPSERGKTNNHPTLKPIKMMEELINVVSYLNKLTNSPTNSIVIDPFAGSGTTVIAAIRSGRPVIAIEKEKEYFDIMVDRAEQELNNKTTDLFG